MFRFRKFFLMVSLVLSCVANVHSAQARDLKIGISQEFESMNPLIAQMMASHIIYGFLGRPLNVANADWQWQCLICTEMPTFENGKARFIEVGGKKMIEMDWEIKPGVTWADGTPVTGKDVKLGWEIGSSPNVSTGEKEVYTVIEKVDIDSANPKKFKMTINRLEFSYNRLGTFYLIPDHIERAIWEKSKGTVGEYEKQTAYSTDVKNPGLYFGPYKVVEMQLGSHIIMESNPHFYGPKPAFEKIIIKHIPDTSTLEANLLSGTIDMICELGFSMDQALAFEKKMNSDPALKSKYVLNLREGATYEHIDLSFRNPILQDVKVRQALMYSIDREKMVQAIFEGRQKVALHNTHPLDPYYTEDVTKYSYDLAKAEALLDEAGWKKGPDGIRVKDGKKLSLLFQTTAGNKIRELVQVYLQSEWKKAGIDVVIRNEPARVYFGETVHKGLYEGMAMFAYVSSPENPPYSITHSKNIPTKENGYSGQNTGGWKNDEKDALLDKVIVEFDLEKRKELMKAYLQIYTREVPTIPLYNRVEISVTPAWLKNYQLTGHQFATPYFMENWTVAE